jgi:hypothetical protein
MRILDFLPLVIASVLGSAFAAIVAWALWRARVRSIRMQAAAESESEIARLNERLSALNDDLCRTRSRVSELETNQRCEGDDWDMHQIFECNSDKLRCGPSSQRCHDRCSVSKYRGRSAWIEVHLPFTIVAKSALGYVRTLYEKIREFHVHNLCGPRVFHNRFRELKYSFGSKTLAKAIDEFHYVNVTLPIQEMENRIATAKKAVRRARAGT